MYRRRTGEVCDCVCLFIGSVCVSVCTHGDGCRAGEELFVKSGSYEVCVCVCVCVREEFPLPLFVCLFSPFLSRALEGQAICFVYDSNPFAHETAVIPF